MVICSTHPQRLNPYMTSFVHDVMTQSGIVAGDVAIEVVDLAIRGLPLYDEPAVPSTLPAELPSPTHTATHTQIWLTTICRYEAFIFVTPQYNWRVPATLKKTLDYLYHECKGRSAGIVLYNSRGCGKAADHLGGILAGFRMTTATVAVECERVGGVPASMQEAWRHDCNKDNLIRFGELMHLLVPARYSTVHPSHSEVR